MKNKDKTFHIDTRIETGLFKIVNKQNKTVTEYIFTDKDAAKLYLKHFKKQDPLRFNGCKIKDVETVENAYYYNEANGEYYYD